MTEANVPATPADAVKQIRVTMKILGFLQATGDLDAAQLREAEESIDAALAVIERTLRAGDRQLPVFTLAEVAARAQHRAPCGQVAAAPALRLVKGGAA